MKLDQKSTSAVAPPDSVESAEEVEDTEETEEPVTEWIAAHAKKNRAIVKCYFITPGK